MAQDHTEYLAAKVLNEQQLVSYRMLSRALKVHNNLAKQMLYEFHHKQNTKKAGSVHATYLITGTQRPSLTNGVHNPEDGADNTVSSSLPLPSSSMPGPDGEDEVEDVPRKSMLLVREEHLAEAREKFEHITGIHIYSLQAKGLSDFQALTECNRQIAANYASEDPLQAWKQYGTIKNAHVRRRTGRAAIPPAATPAPTVKHGDVNIKSEALTKTTPASSNPASEMTPAKTERVTAAKPKSDIFKSFAKTQPPKPEEAGKDKSRSQSTAKTDEDVPMGGFSDDDDDDEDAQSEPWADGATSSKVPAGKSKTEREAELKAMMERDDDDDDAMEDVASPEENDIKDEETEGAIDKPAVQPEPESQDTTTVENGRRRGRRRVIKKKTVKDEEGYLVTKEEAAWESFSEEDEPAPKKTKMPPSSVKTSFQKGGKPGQGNIMSFFNKK